MTKKLKFFLPVVLFAGLVSVFFTGLYQDPSLVQSPFIGKPAPDFSLPSLEQPEQVIQLADWRGRISLVNVWASWCPGCAREHAMLLAISENSDIPIYGLNWKDERPAALKWLQQRGNPYAATAFDRDNITGIEWGVYGAPETFLLDKVGVIQYKLVGPLTPDIWQNEFLPRIQALQEQG